MFTYCLNNPVLLSDNLGLRAVCRDITLEDNSKSPEDIMSSKSISFYKDVLVIKVPNWISFFPETSSFSFGVILMGQKGDMDLLRHEYGHTRQLQELGVWDYYKYVVKPSVYRYNKTVEKVYTWDSYYSTPWEYQADQYGGVNGTYMPWARESSERYWDRVNSLRN